MKRRRKYSKRKKTRSSFPLNTGTIFGLFTLSCAALAALLFFSFTQNGETLTEINRYLVGYFGVLSLLIPLNLLLFALLFSRIQIVSRLNLTIGFLVVTVCLLGLLQSGLVGQELFLQLALLLGSGITYIIFLSGFLIGVVVLFNISISQLIQLMSSVLKGISVVTSEKILPLLKTRTDKYLSDMKAITIKGMKDQAPAIPASASTDSVSQKSTEKKQDMSEELVLNKPLELGVWEYPPLSLLSEHHSKAERGDVKKIAATIEKTLQSFGVQSRVSEINVGPSVTQYAIEIALGTKLSKITGLANDLALATEAPTGQVRIEAPMPGRNLVGIEIPNRSLELVSLKAMLS